MCYTRDISLNHDLIFSVPIVKHNTLCMFPNAECLESELDLPDYFFPCKILILDYRPWKRMLPLDQETILGVQSAVSGDVQGGM